MQDTLPLHWTKKGNLDRRFSLGSCGRMKPGNIVKNLRRGLPKPTYTGRQNLVEVNILCLRHDLDQWEREGEIARLKEEVKEAEDAARQAYPDKDRAEQEIYENKERIEELETKIRDAVAVLE